MVSKLTIVFFSFLLGSTVFACGGGDILKLNDIKHFDAWSLVDEQSNRQYFFSDDLNSCHFVGDSSGSRTHQYCVGGDSDYPTVTLEVLATGEITKYRAMHKDIRMRGCNELEKLD
jgi:hypothetical protein